MGCGASVVAPAQQDANQDPRRVRQRIKLEPGGENAQLSSRSLERKLQSRVIERNASERKDGKHGNNNASQIHILLLGAGDSGKTTLFKQVGLVSTDAFYFSLSLVIDALSLCYPTLFDRQ